MNLNDLENFSGSIKDLIKLYFNINISSNLLTVLLNDHYNVLSVWADQNNVSIDNLISKLEFSIDSKANIELLSMENNISKVKLIIDEISIFMDFQYNNEC